MNKKIISLFALGGVSTSILLAAGPSVAMDSKSAVNADPVSTITAKKLDNWDATKGTIISYASDNKGNLYVAAKVGSGTSADIKVFENNKEYFSAVAYNANSGTPTGQKIVLMDNTMTAGNPQSIILQSVNGTIVLAAGYGSDAGAAATSIGLFEVNSSEKFDAASLMVGQVTNASCQYPSELKIAYIDSTYVASYVNGATKFTVDKLTKSSNTWTSSALTVDGSVTVADASTFTSVTSNNKDFFAFSTLKSGNFATYSMKVDSSTGKYTLVELKEGTNTNLVLKSSITSNGEIVAQEKGASTVYGWSYQLQSDGSFKVNQNGEILLANFTGLSLADNVTIDTNQDVFYNTTSSIYEGKFTSDGYSKENVLEIKNGLPTTITAIGLVQYNVENGNVDFAVDADSKVELYQFSTASSSSSNTALIILGSIFGVIAGVGIIGGLIYYFYSKKTAK